MKNTVHTEHNAEQRDTPDQRTKKWILRALYFLLIPSVLIVIFLFSTQLKSLLVLSSIHPTILSVLGSHYFHSDLAHLVGNLFLYLVIMVIVFALDWRTNRIMLSVNLVLLFVILPVVSSLLMVLVFSAAGITLSESGFSAVVAGVFGYLAFSTLHFIRTYAGVQFKKSMFSLLWDILFVNLLWISLIYGYFPMVVVLVVLLLVSLVYTYRDYLKIFQLIHSKDRWQRITVPLLLMCLFFGPSLLFPETIRYGTNVVNIFAHYIGYVYGFFIPAVVSTYGLGRRLQ